MYSAVHRRDTDANSCNGDITKVEFYANGTKIGESNSFPYWFTWNNAPVGNHNLTAKIITSSGSFAFSDTVPITIIQGAGCVAEGYILREYWNNIPGDNISDIPTYNPEGNSRPEIFEGVPNHGDNYAERFRGYVCAPQTGQYTFWIASDDDGELWLSTDENPTNKVRIAYVSGYTSSRQWDKYPSQKSTLINLIAGQKYYIEALHKEETGADNISVGWQLPDATFERPIPGIRLSPYEPTEYISPQVEITSPLNGDSFTNPRAVVIYATASSKVEFFVDFLKIAEDAEAPFRINWNFPDPGNHVLVAKVRDNNNFLSTSREVNVNIAYTGGNPVPLEFIPVNAQWRYLDNGSNQGTAWRAIGFNDAGWLIGNAQLGYGDGDEATIISYGGDEDNKYITSYFRKTFNVIDASLITDLELLLLRDDGAVVYLNGMEIYRSNMPTGTILYTTRASSSITYPDESTGYLTSAINSALLINGTNVIAVEIHQVSKTNLDISFNFILRANVISNLNSPLNLITNGTNIENINSDYGLKVFPNPNTGLVNIIYKGKSQREIKLRITTIIGQVVMEENYGQFTGELTKLIDMSKTPKGIYLLEIISGDETITEKLLIE